MAARQPFNVTRGLSAPGTLTIGPPPSPYKFSRLIHASVYSATSVAEPQYARVVITIYEGLTAIYSVSHSFSPDMRIEFNLIELACNMPPVLDFQSVGTYDIRVTADVACSVKFLIKQS